MKSRSTLLRALMCAAVLALLASGPHLRRRSTCPPSRSPTTRRSTFRWPARARRRQRREVRRGRQVHRTARRRSRSRSRRWSPRSSSAATSRRTSCGPSRATAPSRTSASSIVGDSNDSGSNVYQTGKKQFGLMITAEPCYTVGRPGELVVATSMAGRPEEDGQLAPFALQRLPHAGREGRLQHDRRPDLQGQEARRARPGRARDALVAEPTGAAALNPKAMEEAQARARRRPRTRRSPAAARRSSRTTRAAPFVSPPRRCATAAARWRPTRPRRRRPRWTP